MATLSPCQTRVKPMFFHLIQVPPPPSTPDTVTDWFYSQALDSFSHKEEPRKDAQSAKSTKSSRKNAEIIGVRGPKAKFQHPWAACPPFSHSYPFPNSGGSEGKESICNASTRFWFLCWEDPLDKGMATHSSILAWRILWTEEPHGYSPWGHRVGHDWVTNTFTSLTKSPQVLNLDLCEFKKKYIPVICDQFSVLGLPGILVLFLHLRKSFKKTNKEIFHLMTLPPNKATCFCRYFLFQPSFLLENGHIIYDQPKLWMQSQFYKKAGILNPFCYRRGIN